MNRWQEILRKSITSRKALEQGLHNRINIEELQDFLPDFPMRINPYFLSLIEEVGDPIWKQCIPDQKEAEDSVCMADPLGEDHHSPVPFLVHKYPDRALFLVAHECAMYCRFCTRNRMVGKEKMHITDADLERCYDYLRSTPSVREVLISGGDPLLLSDTRLDNILSTLRAIEHIEVIRIGSRVPSVLPMRVTEELVTMLKKHHPLYLNLHFNHPREITEEASRACTMLADAGIPLGCHTVLLKGVNDDAKVLKELFLKLLKIRVKPYYLFQADLTRGTDHFRTHSSVGIKLIKELHGHISGMAIPKLALDAPGGNGKILLSPDYILERGEHLVFENYEGKICTYPEAEI